MEDLKKEWELGELKRENLRKSLEQVNSQSSSVLFFTLQWKELEDHFDSIRKSIEKRLDFVEFREREVETRMGLLREREEEIGLKKSELSVLSKKIEECNVEIKFKEEEIDWMRKLLEDCSSEFDSKSGELDSVMKSVDDCSKELCLKKEQLRSVQNSISECCNKLEGKEFELACLQNSINECSNQLDLKRNELVRSEEVIVEQGKQLSENEKKLDSIKSLIQDYEEELETKKENYEALEKAVGVHAAKLDYFEQKLGLIDEKISARLQELDSLLALIVRRKEDLEAKEEKLHSKEKQLSSVQIWIEGCTKQLEGKEEELHSKEKQLGSVLISIEGCTKQLEGKEEELHSKEKQLGSVLISIEGCTKQLEAKEEELHSKEKQLSSVQMSVKGCTKLLEAKEDELTSIKNSILEFTKELESKKQRFEAIQKSVEKLFGVVKSEEKPLDLVEKVGDECLQVAGVKDDHIGSIKRSLEERLDGLETEKRQFEARVKEFELKEKHFDSVKKSVEQQRKELELKEKKLINALHSQASSENPRSFDTHALGITNTESANPVTNQIKTETPENFIICNASEASTADLVVGATMDGMALQSILNEHLEDPCLRKNEVLSALQMSPDPAKFVLDLMLGISSQHTKKDGTGFEESFLKISLLMLEQLFQVSPHVQPKVKSDALTLAKEWKTKLNPSAENSTEILCFLQFVAAFGLAHSLNRDEIFKLLATIAQHQQARNVCQVLGFTDMIPDFVGSLVARKQYIEAVRFVCAIDCKDKCPPKQLLELFFDDMNRAACDRCKIGKNSPEVQQKATDEWIASLKSVIECVKDCRLESFMPVEVIEKSISKLEKQKLSLTFSAVQPNVHGRTICNTGLSVPGNHSSPVPAVQQQFHGGNYAFTIGTQWQEQFTYVSNPVTRPPQQFQGMLHASVPLARLHGPSNKRARTDGLVTNSYTPQVPTLNPKIHPASLHGLGVQPNPGINHFRSAANLEHSSTSATRQYLIHNRPKPP